MSFHDDMRGVWAINAAETAVLLYVVRGRQNAGADKTEEPLAGEPAQSRLVESSHEIHDVPACEQGDRLALSVSECIRGILARGDAYAVVRVGTRNGVVQFTQRSGADLIHLPAPTQKKRPPAVLRQLEIERLVLSFFDLVTLPPIGFADYEAEILPGHVAQCSELLPDVAMSRSAKLEKARVTGDADERQGDERCNRRIDELSHAKEHGRDQRGHPPRLSAQYSEKRFVCQRIETLMPAGRAPCQPDTRAPSGVKAQRAIARSPIISAGMTAVALYRCVPNCAGRCGVL